MMTQSMVHTVSLLQGSSSSLSSQCSAHWAEGAILRWKAVMRRVGAKTQIGLWRNSLDWSNLYACLYTGQQSVAIGSRTLAQGRFLPCKKVSQSFILNFNLYDNDTKLSHSALERMYHCNLVDDSLQREILGILQFSWCRVDSSGRQGVNILHPTCPSVRCCLDILESYCHPKC